MNLGDQRLVHDFISALENGSFERWLEGLDLPAEETPGFRADDRIPLAGTFA